MFHGSSSSTSTARRTRLLRGLAAGLAATLAVPALALAAPANAATGTAKVKTQRMTDATLKSTQHGWYEAGQKLTLVCSKRGQSIKGYFSFNLPNGGWDNLWYRTSDGHYVGDVDIDTGTFNAVAPDCSKVDNPAPANTPAPVAATNGRPKGQTLGSNPYAAGFTGYCTYGAQEFVKRNAGYYLNETRHAMYWDDDARARGWKVVLDAEPRSVVVFEPSVVGGVGHVAWVNSVDKRSDGRYINITEMNYGAGGTEANGYRTKGFNKENNRIVKDVPGMSYILIP